MSAYTKKNQDMEYLDRIAIGKSLYLILLLRIDMQMKNFGRRFLKRFMAAFFKIFFEIQELKIYKP